MYRESNFQRSSILFPIIYVLLLCACCMRHHKHSSILFPIIYVLLLRACCMRHHKSFRVISFSGLGFLYLYSLK
uniref:Uncharacterized protein n=1 Tax=Arundo donax TaxID=35708 RepID=A0A0A9FCZ0_ARUDO